MKKLLTSLSLILLLALTAILVSCGEPTDEKKEYKVMISHTEGASVLSENPARVEEGGTAVFHIAIAEGYVY